MDGGKGTDCLSVHLSWSNRFVLMVKRGYRDTAYHNWSHALSVTHFFYVLDHQCHLLSHLSNLEQLALFISCLCHDIDHRGTNNAFQESSVSPRERGKCVEEFII